MRHCRFLLFGLVFLFSVAGQAQDALFTLHDYQPLWLNPANTGSFNGSVRVGGVYRGQWYSIEGIQSPTAYVDAPLAFGLRKQDWIGVGMTLTNSRFPFEGFGMGDQAPGVDIVQNFFGFSAAYHLSLDKKRRNILTIGAQYGSVSYGAEFNGTLRQEGNIMGAPGFQDAGFNEFMPNMMSPDGERNNESVNDLNAGVKLKLLLDPKKDNVLEAGVTMMHLLSPERRPIFRQEDIDSTQMSGERSLGDLKSTLLAHARLDLAMNDKWRFQPTLLFGSAQNSNFVSVQAWGQRNLKKNLDLRLGLGYRTADAAQFLIGMDFGQLRTALSYDLTLSQARNVNSSQGSFEVSAMYIFNIYKKPDVTPTILCPDI